jgi:DNA-binding NarL/FixJ family response regulator
MDNPMVARERNDQLESTEPNSGAIRGGAIRILIVDDHEGVRNGLRTLLEPFHKIDVIGESADGLTALSLTEELVPDLLLLDVEMPGMNGIEVARRLRRTGRSIHILGLSSHDSNSYIEMLIRVGFDGYLTKDEAPDLLVQAICDVHEGKTGWFSNRAERSLPSIN